MPNPEVMKVTNPFKRRGLALGLRGAARDFAGAVGPPLEIQWYSKATGNWCSDAVPTRGEFLIRRGGSRRPRAVTAVLELIPPYLAVLKRESGTIDAAQQQMQRTAHGETRRGR